MKKLIEILRQATRELKVEYLKQTEVWAKESFHTMLKMIDEVNAQEKELETIKQGRYDWNEWIEDWVTLPSWKRHILKQGYYPQTGAGRTPEIVNQRMDEGRFFIGGNCAYSIQCKTRDYNDTRRKGEDVHIEKMMKYAEKHYEGSLVKLAQRIIKKGLDISKMTMESGFMDMNLEILLTDGEKSVRAWTIIASGMVQRPHYRYLVK